MYSPLTRDELETYTEVATSIRPRAAQFPFRLIPYTGLTSGEFLHLKSDWIHWGDGDALNEDRPPVIEIPPSSECLNLRWDPKPPHTVSKAGVCTTCGKQDREEWKPLDGTRVRQVPVIQPDAQDALYRWFQTLDREGVPYSPAGLRQVYQLVESRSPLNRELSHGNLVRTFVSVCAEQGISRDHIVSIAPFNNTSKEINTILRRSSTDYDLKTRAIDRLRALKSVEPATGRQVAEVLSAKTNAEHAALRRFHTAGLVEVVEERQSNESGHSAPLYEISPTVDIDEGIPCPKDGCDRSFTTLSGRNRHIRQGHGEEIEQLG